MEWRQNFGLSMVVAVRYYFFVFISLGYESAGLYCVTNDKNHFLCSVSLGKGVSPFLKFRY